MSAAPDLPSLPRLDTTSVPTPSWRAVARAQLRATGLALRTDLIVGACLLAGMGLLLEFDVFRGRGLDYDAVNVALQLFVVSLFAPMTVWKGDEPFRRAYHWAMPVERGPHTLAKMLGGLGWLLGLAGAYVLSVLIVALLTGGGVQTGGGMERELMERAGGAGFDRQDLSFHGHAWLWLVPFGSVAVAYLLGSIVALSTDHPWRFFGGFIFLVVMLVAVSIGGGLSAGPLEVVRDFLLMGPYSLYTVITGGALDLGVWLGATALWLAIGSAGVLIASYRRQER